MAVNTTQAIRQEVIDSRREYQRKYYLANIEKAKAYQREYNLSHKKKQARPRCGHGGARSKSKIDHNRVVVKNNLTRSDIMQAPPDKAVKMLTNIIEGRYVLG